MSEENNEKIIAGELRAIRKLLARLIEVLIHRKRDESSDAVKPEIRTKSKRVDTDWHPSPSLNKVDTQTENEDGAGGGGRGRNGARSPEGGGGGSGSAGSGGGGGTRFWEAYAVRYLAGTFVGAASLGAVLLVHRPEFLESLDKKTVSELVPALTGDLSAAAIILYIGFAFAFSYIASAPMYVLHQFRAYLFKSNDAGLVTPTRSAVVAPVFAIVAGVLASLVEPWWGWITIPVIQFLPILAVSYSWLSIRNTKTDGVKEDAVSSFYDRLVSARSTDSAARSHYVESYRHLREHGNAFSLAILNVIFALYLVSAPDIQHLKWMFILWLLPASIGWIMATHLEARLAVVISKDSTRPSRHL